MWDERLCANDQRTAFGKNGTYESLEISGLAAGGDRPTPTCGADGGMHNERGISRFAAPKQASR
jgi:hypothetical protein